MFVIKKFLAKYFIFVAKKFLGPNFFTTFFRQHAASILVYVGLWVVW